jgi:UrcA family protein
MSTSSATSRNRRILLSGVSAILLSAALSIGEAQADRSEVRQVKVRFAELDLSKPAGAEALYRRLEKAASRVCGNTSIGFTKRTNSECYQTALSNAVIQVNSPLLSEIHGVQMERVAAKK